MGRAQGAKLFGITMNVHVPFDVGLRNLYGNQYIRANNAWDSSQVNGTGSQEPKFGKSPYVRQTVWQSDKILCSKKLAEGKFLRSPPPISLYGRRRMTLVFKNFCEPTSVVFGRAIKFCVMTKLSERTLFLFDSRSSIGATQH